MAQETLDGGTDKDPPVCDSNGSSVSRSIRHATAEMIERAINEPAPDSQPSPAAEARFIRRVSDAIDELGTLLRSITRAIAILPVMVLLALASVLPACILLTLLGVEFDAIDNVGNEVERLVRSRTALISTTGVTTAVLGFAAWTVRRWR